MDETEKERKAAPEKMGALRLTKAVRDVQIEGNRDGCAKALLGKAERPSCLGNMTVRYEETLLSMVGAEKRVWHEMARCDDKADQIWSVSRYVIPFQKGISFQAKAS